MSSVDRPGGDSRDRYVAPDGWYVAPDAAGREEYHPPSKSIADEEAAYNLRIAAMLRKAAEQSMPNGGRSTDQPQVRRGLSVYAGEELTRETFVINGERVTFDYTGTAGPRIEVDNRERICEPGIAPVVPLPDRSARRARSDRRRSR